MNRFGLLLTTLAAACAYEPPVGDHTAVFHGSVGGPITHVMAVSPLAGDHQRVVAPVEAGEFAIELGAERPWTLVFVDATRTGSAMVGGVLRSDSLDTFLPGKRGATVDLGTISIDNREATMAGSSDDLDAALGLSRRTLATIGGVDDLAVRYANPDIDRDGQIDTHQARLEMHLEFALTARGQAATPDDFIAAVDLGYEHTGTGIYGRLPEAFGKVDRDTASVTFEQPYWGYEAGPFTPAVPAGTPCTQLTFGDAQTFGVFARPDHPIPSGTYTFRSGEHVMEFAMVRPPTEMTMHQVMPLVRFAPVTPGCFEDCAIGAVEFAWRRFTANGWVEISNEEARALEPRGSVDLLAADGSHRRFEFPLGVPSGSVPWHHDLYRAPQAMKTGSIVYMNIAFQTRQGIKMHASLGEGHVEGGHELGKPDADATETR